MHCRCRAPASGKSIAEKGIWDPATSRGTTLRVPSMGLGSPLLPHAYNFYLILRLRSYAVIRLTKRGDGRVRCSKENSTANTVCLLSSEMTRLGSQDRLLTLAPGRDEGATMIHISFILEGFLPGPHHRLVFAPSHIIRAGLRSVISRWTA